MKGSSTIIFCISSPALSSIICIIHKFVYEEKLKGNVQICRTDLKKKTNIFSSSPQKSLYEVFFFPQSNWYDSLGCSGVVGVSSHTKFSLFLLKMLWGPHHIWIASTTSVNWRVTYVLHYYMTYSELDWNFI